MTPYSTFNKLCQDKQVTPYEVSKKTGVAQQTFSAWKKGEYEPKIDKLCKIANYFGVAVTIFIEEWKS